MLNPKIRPVDWKDGVCVLLDQTRLPAECVYVDCETSGEIEDAIRRLVVRGAPAIGVAGAYGCVIAAQEAERDAARREDVFRAAVARIANARPTAVNLRWAVDRMVRCWDAEKNSPETSRRLLHEARRIHEEDIEWNRKLAEFGADVLPNGEVITYCNAGELATAGIGTALGVIRAGHARGKVTHVYTCETRPVLQGLRLTAWELQTHGVPFTIICDNMAGLILREGRVKAIVVGADRIAENGDIANKVGTYGLAVLAKHHGVPFYVAAPSSTFDLKTAGGEDIVIEERAAHEILGILPNAGILAQARVRNPSFDMTPASLIAGLICEKGVVMAPTREKIRQLFGLSEFGQARPQLI